MTSRRFPICMKTEASHRDPAKLYYLVAANGLFQVRTAATHRSVTRVTNAIPGLQPEIEHVELQLPRVPAALLEDVLAFFAEMYERYRGEGIVVLFFDPALREFRVDAPSQRISGYSDTQGRWWSDYHLLYDKLARPEGCLRVGTLHSHASLSAYASHVDCEDEKYEDGLHVVYGSFASPQLTCSASFVADGHRFHVRPEDALEDAGVPRRPAPAEWMARVECIETPWGASGSGNGSHANGSVRGENGHEH